MDDDGAWLQAFLKKSGLLVYQGHPTALQVCWDKPKASVMMHPKDGVHETCDDVFVSVHEETEEIMHPLPE